MGGIGSTIAKGAGAVASSPSTQNSSANSSFDGGSLESGGRIGDKTFIFGGNPNVAQGMQLLSNPFVLIAVGVVALAWIRSR